MGKRNFRLIVFAALSLFPIAVFQNCSSFKAGNFAIDSSSSEGLQVVGNGPSTAIASTPNSTIATNPTPVPPSSVIQTPVPENVSSMPLPIAKLNYSLTFDDEFTSLKTISNSSSYNGSKWYNGVDQCCMGDSTGLPGVMYPTLANGQSVDPYTLIPGGGLNITLSKINNVWYSGILTSVDLAGKGFSQQYGYFEIRAKLPAGPSTWPAFWLLNTASLASGAPAGEIDIFEQFGQFPNNFCTTLHDWGAGTTPYYNCGTTVSNMETDFHTWGFLWTEDSMTLFFDNSQVLQTVTPTVMQQPYYMLIDLGVGGGWPTDKTPSANIMQVQYVRVYAPK